MTPQRKRVLAVDFGDRRTGLAGTDGSGTLVVPLPALHGLGERGCAEAVAATARDRDSEVVVVGLPLDARGKVGERARRTLVFVDTLRPLSPCPVETVDETYSTDEAHERLKALGLKAARRRAHADSVAAMVICERYLAGLHRRRPASET
ncbi:MAG: Holliday junction resolvase RuvX [Planctomycetota bacterium]